MDNFIFEQFPYTNKILAETLNLSLQHKYLRYETITKHKHTPDSDFLQKW